MYRIAVIGAGSVSHSKRLINDLCSLPVIHDATVVLMSPHEERVAVVARYARNIIETEQISARIETTNDHRVAFEGANVVFFLFDSGGFSAYDGDYRIVHGFGIDICIGDTMNPTGIMKACRNITLLRILADQIPTSCPNALVINYVNPMGAMGIAATEFGLDRYIGICGGVEATRNTIAHCLERPVSSISFTFAGINHMTWALAIESAGEDLYPELQRKMSAPAWIAAEPVRFEVMQQFGYFVTETSGHLSDFFPWFRTSRKAREAYCSGTGYSGARGAYHRYASYIHRRLTDIDYLQYESGRLEPMSDDYGPSIANAWLSGREYRCFGNVSNAGGLIDNLPTDSTVEVPVKIGPGASSSPSRVTLPDVPAALCSSNITVQKLTVRAALSGDFRSLLTALALDPVTGATLTLPEIREMATQLVGNNRRWIPEGWFTDLSETADISEHASATPVKIPGEHLLEIVRRYDLARRAATATGPPPSLSESSPTE